MLANSNRFDCQKCGWRLDFWSLEVQMWIVFNYYSVSHQQITRVCIGVHIELFNFFRALLFLKVCKNLALSWREADRSGNWFIPPLQLALKKLFVIHSGNIMYVSHKFFTWSSSTSAVWSCLFWGILHDWKRKEKVNKLPVNRLSCRRLSINKELLAIRK